MLLVYGLFGMQFMQGKAQACNDESISAKLDCVGSFTPPDGGLPLERWWGNPDNGNFDNIGYAMLTLFEMATLEMWPDMLFLAMDTNDVGKAPLINSNPWMSVYIISWIVVSAFFLLNLFVGVVLENFNKIRAQEDGSGLISDEQKEWMRTHTHILRSTAQKALRAPWGRSRFARFRKYLFTIVTQPSFDYVVAAIVL